MAALSLAGCSTDEIDKWSGSSSLAWFTTTNVTNYSFVSEADNVTEHTIQVPITLATPVKSADRKINIEVARQPANAATTFSYDNPVTVKADSTSAVLNVTVKRTANLKESTDTIIFKITNSDDFITGLADNLEATVVVYDDFIRPSWWDNKYNTTRFIGECNKLKLNIIYAVFGSLDKPCGENNEWYSNDGTLALFKLDEYCHSHYDKDFIYIEETDVEL